MEQIKVGDKVRVREDAQRIFMYGLNPLWFTEESTVVRLEYPDVVVVKLDAENHLAASLSVPTKYLVKIDAEAKEARFKRGDKVVFIPTGKVKVVSRINNGNSLYDYIVTELNGQSSIGVSESDLEPYTEQTEEKKLDGITEETANELSDMLEGYYNAMETIKDKSYWTAYAADLAKEIAVKVANKFNDPKETADYAVLVAMAVVEGLKRK